MQVVVHTAAIPDPVHDPAHVVFATNCTIAFNVAEAVAVTQQRGAAGAAAGFTVQ
jgi:hypothetical protein